MASIVLVQEFSGRSFFAAALLACCLSFHAWADESENVAEDLAKDELPLELDPLTVQGERISVQQEAIYRLIRQAFQRKKSSRRADIDQVVCWLDRGVGTRLKYLYCARNGDIWAREPGAATDMGSGGGGLFIQYRDVGAYGKFLRSRGQMTRGKLERIFAGLPRPELDEEFAIQVAAGEKPPRDLPDDEELERFARAYLAVDTLWGEGVDDDTMEAAITDEGLELARYNRLIDIIDAYPSLRDQVAQRVAQLRVSDSE